ncbi:MAG: hypothetical protein WED34_04650 [Planctomycetales bacterium]
MTARHIGPWSVALLVLCLHSVARCAQNADERATADEKPAADAAEQPAQPPVRETVAGRWQLVLTQEGTDFPLMLLDVERRGDAFAAKVVDAHSQFEDPKVEKFQGDKTSLQLVLSANEGEKYEIQGRLADNVVYGNVLFEGGRCDPARLLPTEAADLADAKPAPSPELNALRDAVREPDSAAALAKFARENPESPLSLAAWQQAVAFAAGTEDAEKQVRELSEGYVKSAERWGPRMVASARVNVALQLVRREALPEVAEQSLAAAEAAFDESQKKSLAPVLGMLREALAEQKRRQAIAEAREAIVRGKDEEQRRQAVATLEGLYREHPLDPVIVFTLAQHAEAQKQADKALDLYSRLAVLPKMEGTLFSLLEAEDQDAPYPSEAAQRLWEDKHKNLEGFEEHLETVYRRAIHAFAAGQPAAAQPAGNHTVLVELFTGSECPPCVAADVAAGALETVFPKEQVVVLRYHQHIPGPDPLTNPDGWDRFQTYGLQGTPAILVDGEQFEGTAGPLFMAPQGYKQLRSEIEPRVAVKSDVKIELSAKAANGKLDLAAKVDGLGNAAQRAHLVLVLAEPEVSYKAGNGVRHHEMVVRSMPAGAEGVEAEEGRLAFSRQLPLDEFKAGLEKYLADFEEEEGVEFPAKPLALDKLYLIAFVQDGETGKVLGTRAVPVTGKLEYPKPAADEKPADAPEKP